MNKIAFGRLSNQAIVHAIEYQLMCETLWLVKKFAFTNTEFHTQTHTHINIRPMALIVMVLPDKNLVEMIIGGCAPNLYCTSHIHAHF